MDYQKWLKSVSSQYNVTESFLIQVLEEALVDIDTTIALFENGKILFPQFYQSVRGTSVTMCFKNVLSVLDAKEFNLNRLKEELSWYRKSMLETV